MFTAILLAGSIVPADCPRPAARLAAAVDRVVYRVAARPHRLRAAAQRIWHGRRGCR